MPTIEPDFAMQALAMHEWAENIRRHLDDEESLLKIAADIDVNADALAPKGSTIRTCEHCRHLRPFDLTKDVLTCPVVNIRISQESSWDFGCNLFEAKDGPESRG